MKSCPTCNSSNGLREIIYDMPDGAVDETKFAIGGCCMSDHDPTIKCIECGWEGEFVDNMRPGNKSLDAVQLQDISEMTDSEIDEYAKKIWGKFAKTKGGDNGRTKS